MQQVWKDAGWWLRDAWSDWLGIACTTVGLILFVAMAVSIAMHFDRVQCRATAEAMSVGWTWGAYTSCMIVVDGHAIPLDAYRVVKTAP